MITRSQMRRQLRAQGGIMSVAPREKFGIGSTIKDRIRKLIPNELADVAVKAAPFIAPFYPGYAAIARGLGRFDQRGSISDALKQGAATYAGGKAVRGFAGAQGPSGGLDTFSMEGFKERGAGRLFQGGEKEIGINSGRGGSSSSAEARRIANATDATKPTGIMERATAATIDKIPLADKLPQIVKEKLLVGGITSGASALYSYFTGEFEPQEPGETMGEYMARRNTRVKQQMRGYMDSYYTPLRNPQYAAMSDEEKTNYINNIVGQTSLEGTTDYQGENMAKGGRVGYQTGGISMTNTAAQNRAINNARRFAANTELQAPRERIQQQMRGMGKSGFQAPQAQNINSNINAIKAAASVPYNMVKGIIGNPLDPKALTQVSLTQAQKQRLNEIAQAKGTATGNINYSDYGSPTSTFSGVYPKTMSPLDASLATTMGGTNFRTNSNGEIEFLGGKYDFEKSDNPLLKFIDQGGISGAVAKGVEGIGSLLTPSTATAAEPSAMPQGSPGQLNPTPTPDASGYDFNSEFYRNNPDPFTKDYDRFLAAYAKATGGGTTTISPDGQVSTSFGNYDPSNTYGYYTRNQHQYGPDHGDFYSMFGDDEKTKMKSIMESMYGAPGMLDPRDRSGYTNTGFTPALMNQGGRVGLMGGSMPMGEPRVNQGGITELDYRAKGGFVPVGIKEKADDVPAMLSKNEFVFTADAVRGAGNGSIENGAQKMYDTMKNLERRIT